MLLLPTAIYIHHVQTRKTEVANREANRRWGLRCVEIKHIFKRHQQLQLTLCFDRMHDIDTNRPDKGVAVRGGIW